MKLFFRDAAGRRTASITLANIRWVMRDDLGLVNADQITVEFDRFPRDFAAVEAVIAKDAEDSPETVIKFDGKAPTGGGFCMMPGKVRLGITLMSDPTGRVRADA